MLDTESRAALLCTRETAKACNKRWSRLINKSDYKRLKDGLRMLRFSLDATPDVFPNHHQNITKLNISCSLHVRNDRGRNSGLISQTH